MLTTRPAMEFTDEDPAALLDVLNRAQDAGIKFRVRADISFNMLTPWHSSQVIVSFPNDQEKAKFMLVM